MFARRCQILIGRLNHTQIYAPEINWIFDIFRMALMVCKLFGEIFNIRFGINLNYENFVKWAKNMQNVEQKD